jgi:phosphohistidine swiveling domain-containing protein
LNSQPVIEPAGRDPLDAAESAFGVTYPGAADLAPGHAVAALSADDLDLAWGLDFHYPRGILPLSHELVCVLAAASRTAAEALPAITGHGLECRVVGPHVYTAGIPVLDAGRRAERAAAAAAEVAAYPDGFAELWRHRAQELNEEYASLAALDLWAATRDQLHRAFERAMAHYAHAWVVHFEVMYPMLAVAEVFRTVCRALGIDDAESADLISSGDSAIRRTDVALRGLAAAAGASGLRPAFEHPGGLLDALRAAPEAAAWLGEFARFLAVHGERSDTIVDVGATAWTDDPEQPLGLIRDLLLQGRSAPTDSHLSRVEAAREQRCQDIADRLPPRDRAVFWRGLGQVRTANFAWWNEDHNAVIDLRAHLPVARLAGELMVRYGFAREDGAYLFAEEIRGLGDFGRPTEIVQERRRFFEHWRARRADLPRLFGTPGPVNDPVLAEIVGVPPAPRHESEGQVLHGLGISAGVARGRARVVVTPDELHRVQTGDILVCEATSPSWTVVFPRLSACVCDVGGALTHAAIICREYGLPCVSAVGVATRFIKDGDLIEVNGRAGTIALLGGGG